MVPATLAAFEGATAFALSFGAPLGAFKVALDLTLAPVALGAYPGM